MSVAANESLVERVLWIIRLRWLAAASVAIVSHFAVRILGLPLSLPPLYAVVALLATYNLAFLLHLKLSKRRRGRIALVSINRSANAQISLDLLCLGALIHFSGGIENPFVLYFVFHMIIASILLSRRAAFLQATFAACIFSAVAGLEYAGVLPHHALGILAGPNLHAHGLYVAAISFALLSTLFIAVYFASSIALELREREDSLEEANALLQEKDRVKSEYVLRVTHDIKGHLAAIRSCLEAVLSGATGALGPDQRNLIERADRRTGTLTSFVRALLELTRMRLASEISMDHVPLEETIRAALSYVEARAERKSIRLRYDIAPGLERMWGARTYLEETLSNLLANSVKYTPPHGSVEVHVRDAGDDLFIEIEDTGIGIPEDELPRVFEEFYRASNARELERDGTGLGLSMAKQVVERHGGSIDVESEVGRGTTVTLTLPKHPGAASADSAASSEPRKVERGEGSTIDAKIP